MNVREAFAAIALAAVACDGRLDRDEAHALQLGESRSIYSGLSEVEMGDLFDTLLTLLRSSGVNGLISEAIPVCRQDNRNLRWQWRLISSMPIGWSRRRKRRCFRRWRPTWLFRPQTRKW